MATDRLVYMANQIGKFFATQGDEAEAVAGIADHLVKFWDPRMREAIKALQGRPDAGLDPLVQKAVARLP
jgi:formate dehydrogenase subunit delta